MKTSDEVVGLLTFLLVLACVIVIAVTFPGCKDIDLYLPTDASVSDGVAESDVALTTPDLLPDVIDPVKACYDAATALANAHEACLNNKEAAVRFHQALVKGWGCQNVKQLDDSVVFYTTCLPALENLTCIQLANGDVPIACIGQFIK